MKIFAALLIGLVIGLMMGMLYLTMTGWHADNVGGPAMGIALVLAVLLAVGLSDWLLWRRPARHQETPPRKLP